MKLWNRFKYELLDWLLEDICCRSICRECPLYRPGRDPECQRYYILRHAHEKLGLREDSPK